MKEFVFTIPEYYGLIPSNGSITVANSSNAVTGVATQFGTDVKVGWYINMLSNSTFQHYYLCCQAINEPDQRSAAERDQHGKRFTYYPHPH